MPHGIKKDKAPARKAPARKERAQGNIPATMQRTVLDRNQMDNPNAPGQVQSTSCARRLASNTDLLETERGTTKESGATSVDSLEGNTRSSKKKELAFLGLNACQHGQYGQRGQKYGQQHGQRQQHVRQHVRQHGQQYVQQHGQHDLHVRPQAARVSYEETYQYLSSVINNQNSQTGELVKVKGILNCYRTLYLANKQKLKDGEAQLVIQQALVGFWSWRLHMLKNQYASSVLPLAFMQINEHGIPAKLDGDVRRAVTMACWIYIEQVNNSDRFKEGGVASIAKAEEMRQVLQQKRLDLEEELVPQATGALPEEIQKQIAHQLEYALYEKMGAPLLYIKIHDIGSVSHEEASEILENLFYNMLQSCMLGAINKIYVNKNEPEDIMQACDRRFALVLHMHLVKAITHHRFPDIEAAIEELNLKISDVIQLVRQVNQHAVTGEQLIGKKSHTAIEDIYAIWLQYVKNDTDGSVLECAKMVLSKEVVQGLYRSNILEVLMNWFPADDTPLYATHKQAVDEKYHANLRILSAAQKLNRRVRDTQECASMRHMPLLENMKKSMPAMLEDVQQSVKAANKDMTAFKNAYAAYVYIKCQEEISNQKDKYISCIKNCNDGKVLSSAHAHTSMHKLTHDLSKYMPMFLQTVGRIEGLFSQPVLDKPQSMSAWLFIENNRIRLILKYFLMYLSDEAQMTNTATYLQDLSMRCGTQYVKNETDDVAYECFNECNLYINHQVSKYYAECGAVLVPVRVLDKSGCIDMMYDIEKEIETFEKNYEQLYASLCAYQEAYETYGGLDNMHNNEYTEVYRQLWNEYGLLDMRVDILGNVQSKVANTQAEIISDQAEVDNIVQAKVDIDQAEVVIDQAEVVIDQAEVDNIVQAKVDIDQAEVVIDQAEVTSVQIEEIPKQKTMLNDGIVYI